MEKTNKIITIAGKRVRVVRGDGAIIDTDCSLCAFCRFDGNEYSCRFPNLKEPCAPYVTEDSYAYFVPAEDGEADTTAQARPVPAEEGKILQKLREFLATATPEELEAKYREFEYLLAPKDEDADKAAEMAARRAYPYDGGTKGDICEASIPIFCKGFKAGIAYDRERLMKKGDDVLEKMIDDFEDWDGSYSRADLPTSYTTRDVARFFANWQRERLASFPTFKGWVARDKCGELYFFKEKPSRGATMWNTEDFCAFMPFPQRNLPSLRWEDDPREVEIIVKLK